MNDKLQLAIEKMKQYHLDCLEELEAYLKQDDSAGELYRHLLETTRNPYSITNGTGFEPESVESVLNLFHNINHAITDDGDITFYYVNDEPRLSFLERNEHKDADFFNGVENKIINWPSDRKPINLKYNLVFIKYWEEDELRKWIADSKLQEKQ